LREGKTEQPEHQAGCRIERDGLSDERNRLGATLLFDQRAGEIAPRIDLR
jgi:hypothetical protein